MVERGNEAKEAKQKTARNILEVRDGGPPCNMVSFESIHNLDLASLESPSLAQWSGRDNGMGCWASWYIV